MGWIKQTIPPCTHPDKPELGQYYGNLTKHMVGDIWECDECKAQFEVIVQKYIEGMQWDMYEVHRLDWKVLDKE